jgi:hypothetical protein
MVTRDIQLEQAVLDLVDNGVDGATRYRSDTPEPLDGFRVDIEVNIKVNPLMRTRIKPDKVAQRLCSSQCSCCFPHVIDAIRLAGGGNAWKEPYQRWFENFTTIPPRESAMSEKTRAEGKHHSDYIPAQVSKGMAPIIWLSHQRQAGN